jgi:hypothetical protein
MGYFSLPFLVYDKGNVSRYFETYQLIISVRANKGTVARNARANCHAATNEIINPTNKDVIELTVAPVPCPTQRRINLISTARREVKTPRAFVGWSNQPISCLRRDRK